MHEKCSRSDGAAVKNGADSGDRQGCILEWREFAKEEDTFVFSEICTCDQKWMDGKNKDRRGSNTTIWMMAAIKPKGGTSKGCFKGLQWPFHPDTDLKLVKL